MDDNQETPPPKQKMRVTTKIGIGVGSFLISIPQVKMIKELLTGDQLTMIQQIRDDQKAGFGEIKTMFTVHETAETEKRMKLREYAWAEISASELRCEKRIDKTDKRVETLEIYAYKTRPNRGGN